MDNSQFLSYFWNLSSENSNEQIVNSAEAIVNLVQTKQKFENVGQKFNTEKYKLYLNLCENATEDLLYTIKRLIGGIASTGIESRRGFLLTFTLLTEKFSDILSLNGLIGIIEKETIVSKGEKGHIKNCALTGKILMLKSILDLPSINSDIILNIFKILFDLITTKNLEEGILQIINVFLDRLTKDYYSEITEKRVIKFFDKFLNLVSKVLTNKTNFGNIKSLSEFSLIFVILSYSNEKYSISQNVNNFFHSNTIANLMSENSLLNYFKLLISHNIKDNKFHTSFDYFLSFLEGLNDSKKVFSIWNILIDSTAQEQLKIVSLKNFQFLIYNFSKFLLEKYFKLEYIRQIFDYDYFLSLTKFNTNKKFKYIVTLITLLTDKIRAVKHDSALNEYALDLLRIFNNEGLSTQTFKNFYSFLFNLLNESSKSQFIESLVRSNDEADSDDLVYRITALKVIMTSHEVDMSKSLKDKVLEFFFKEYYSPETRQDIEFDDLIEDRLLVIIFSYLKISRDEENQIKPLKDKKIIKLLIVIHKFLQDMFTSKSITEFEMQDYKIYLKYYKKFALIVSNTIKNEGEKTDSSKLFSFVKIAMVILILFLKTPNEYADVISDLYEVSQFKDDWQKVYMDIIISLLHKGNNTLSDFVFNSFKKISKHLEMQSIEVLLGFLSQTSGEKEIEDFEDIEEENPNRKGKGKKKVKNGMFEDLENDDVKMA